MCPSSQENAMPRIFNQRHLPIPPDAVRVDRGTKWGNPYVMRDHSDAERNRVCNQFESLMLKQPGFVAAVKAELRGKDLVCWCAPKRCHAETLMRIANEDG